MEPELATTLLIENPLHVWSSVPEEALADGLRSRTSRGTASRHCEGHGYRSRHQSTPVVAGWGSIGKMPLAEPPPRGTRFGSPLVLTRVHWVRPEMVAEVSYVEWTPDGLLRHVVYLGERQDKVATEVRRSRPHVGEMESR